MVSPMLALMFLTLLVWLTLFLKRIPYLQKQGIDAQALDTPDKKHKILPDNIEQPAHNLANLLELPVLFYVLGLLALYLQITSELLLYLAWGYVLTRSIHSFIQCTYNKVIHRFAVYMLSCVLLWAQLILVAASVI